jgi:glutaredoxin 3
MQEITVYTTPVCPYCVSAKRLLSQKGLPFKEVDLERDPELRQKLSAENGGYRTVPMIFIGTEFIGGYSELAALDKSGGLAAKVGRA